PSSGSPESGLPRVNRLPASTSSAASVLSSRPVAEVHRATSYARQSAAASTALRFHRGLFHVHWPQSVQAGLQLAVQSAHGRVFRTQIRDVGLACDVREPVPTARFARRINRWGWLDETTSRP